MSDAPVDLPKAWGDALLFVTAIEADGSAHVIGNAFIVAVTGDTAVALTAEHVAAELGKLATRGTALRGDYRDLLSHPNVGGRLRDVIGLRASDGCVFKLSQFSVPGRRDNDVAACIVQVPDGKVPARFSLKLVPPEIGTTVYACGHSGFKKTHELVGESTGYWGFSAQSTTVMGTVTGSYMRRPGVTPGPCFTIEGHFPSGLSGSPVVCDVGGHPYVCGLVSDSDGHTAVASMLWPGLPMTLPADADGGRLSLLELARRGLFDLVPDELERFSVDGLEVTYRPRSVTPS